MAESPETGIVVDRTQFPVVLVWFGRTYTDADWQASLDEIGKLAVGRLPFVVLNVSRPDMETPTAKQRKAVADWNAAYIAAGHDTLLGWGSVIGSHLLRGVITAILWISTPPYEQKTLANLDEGMAWARQLLARRRQ